MCSYLQQTLLHIFRRTETTKICKVNLTNVNCQSSCQYHNFKQQIAVSANINRCYPSSSSFGDSMTNSGEFTFNFIPIASIERFPQNELPCSSTLLPTTLTFADDWPVAMLKISCLLCWGMLQRVIQLFQVIYHYMNQ